MDPLKGIALKTLSVAVFMGMATCIKKAAEAGVPPGESVFFRSFFAIPVIIIWLIWQHDLAHGLETKNPMGHLWRGLVGGAGMACGFTALGLLPLPEVTAIGYAAPILAVILAAMFLGEEVRLFRLTAVALGLVGVVIVLSQRFSATSVGETTGWRAIGAMAALLGAVFAAMATVFVRKMVQSEKTAAIVFYFSITTTLLSLLTIPFGWIWPGWQIAGLLVLAGVFGGLGQIFLTASYRHAPTAVIAPFDYVSMIFALAIGYAVFDEVPTSRTIAGAVLVVMAGLIIIFRERRLGLERGKSRQAITPQG
ncbi:DMT family transporter [Halovulum sp. GXIMD14793]